MNDFLFDLTGLLVILFGGAIILTPLVAFSMRFAFKPMLETLIRMRQDILARDDLSLQDRRISFLETELQDLQRAMQAVAEASSFQQQLMGSKGSGIEPMKPAETSIGISGKARLPDE